MPSSTMWPWKDKEPQNNEEDNPPAMPALPNIHIQQQVLVTKIDISRYVDGQESVPAYRRGDRVSEQHQGYREHRVKPL